MLYNAGRWAGITLYIPAAMCLTKDINKHDARWITARYTPLCKGSSGYCTVERHVVGVAFISTPIRFVRALLECEIEVVVLNSILQVLSMTLVFYSVHVSLLLHFLPFCHHSPKDGAHYHDVTPCV